MNNYREKQYFENLVKDLTELEMQNLIEVLQEKEAIVDKHSFDDLKKQINNYENRLNDIEELTIKIGALC